MTERDAWAQRYLAIVPTKLTPRDASILLDLIEEDADRFVEALSALALHHDEDTVVCECAPEVNPGCWLGAHGREHTQEARWRVRVLGDDEADFVHLCTPCKESLYRSPEGRRHIFEAMQEDAT